MKDSEMVKQEDELIRLVNERTAVRRRMEERKQREQAAIEYVKRWQKELIREKAQDRLALSFALAMILPCLYGFYKCGIIPLNITVPVGIVSISFAFACVVDAIRLFKGCKRK